MSIIACAVDECESSAVSKGFCPKHYGRLKRNGDPLATLSRPRSSPGTRSTCEIAGCNGIVKGHGYCQKHYQRFKKTGDPLRNPSGRAQEVYVDSDTCRASGCTEPPSKRWLCGKHYQRLRMHGDTETVLHREGCLVDGCEGEHSGHGYCATHRYRFVVTGDPNVTPSGRAGRGTRIACEVNGCKRPCRGGDGFCVLHAGNYRATGYALQSPGPKVKSRACVQCGEIMDFTRLPSGRMRLTSLRRVCTGCRRDSNLTRFVPLLVERDGTGCGIRYSGGP